MGDPFSLPNNLRYAVLGSGSKSNAYIFSDGETTLLIDNGFSSAAAVLRMRSLGFDPVDIDYILVTHGHCDHARGVPLLSTRFRIPIVAHPEVNLGPKKCYKRISLTHNEPLVLGSAEVFPFEVYHDSPKSTGFFFKLGGVRFTLLTDTGKVNECHFKCAKDSDILFLESNYCPIMLAKGGYPDHLKVRIASDFGHLSNIDSISFLNRLASCPDCATKLVYLCHLSENNNSPEVVQKTLRQNYSGTIPTIICPRNEVVAGKV